MPISLPISELWIDRDKIAAYLLNLNHPKGSTKARYFLSYGFDPSKPEELADALFFHAQNEPLVSQVPTQYGTTLVFEGPIRRCPNQKMTSDVKSVWEWTKEHRSQSWSPLTSGRLALPPQRNMA